MSSHNRPKPKKFHRTDRKKTPKVANRGQANLFGFHAVEHAWRNPDRKIKTVFATEKAWATFEKLISDATDLPDRPDPKLISRAELDKILPNTVHQGIAVDADPLPEIFLQDLIIAGKSKDKDLLLMLDQVTDPHNVGAILRSACVFGAGGIIQQRRHAPAPEGVLAKSASGAVEHVPLVEEVNLSTAIEDLQAAGYTAIALDEQGEDMHKALSSPPAKCVFVLGAEGKGLRPKVKETCDMLVRIPHVGEISSLNVSNAAAIGLYALSRL